MEPPAQCPQHSAYWTHSAAALCKMQYLLPTWWKRRVHVCAWLQQAPKEYTSPGIPASETAQWKAPSSGTPRKAREPHFNVRYVQPYGGQPSPQPESLKVLRLSRPSKCRRTLTQHGDSFLLFLTQSAQSGFDDFIWNWNLLHPPYYLFLWLPWLTVLTASPNRPHASVRVAEGLRGLTLDRDLGQVSGLSCS